MKLPFVLTIRAVHSSADSLDLDCVVHDADGESVQSVPIATSARRTAAEACAMAQRYVDDLARVAYQQGRAELETTLDGDELTESHNSLVGKTFTGSIAQ